MRILLSSICAYFLVGCASFPQKNGFTVIDNGNKETLNPYFSDTSKDYVYKVKINAFDKSFGGIFIVKKLGSEHHRIVFTTKMGNTIFDFTFQGDDFKVNRVLKEMNKKILINILRRDFRTLTEENPLLLSTFSKQKDVIMETKILSKKHYFCYADARLQKIIRIRNGKEMVTFQYSADTETHADEIRILRKNIKLEIVLTELK